MAVCLGGIFPNALQAQTAATPPAISPATGSAYAQFNVTLTDSTSGATIYYTLDGTTPTTSSSSVTTGGTVLITKSETIKAMATASGSTTNSAVVSATYQVTGQVVAGQYHTLALKTNGSVWAWGYNPYGEVGDGTTTQRNSAVNISSLSGITQVAAGAYHSVALKSDGTVWAWGLNTSGQLGDNTTTQRTSPVQVKKSNGSGGTTNLTNIVAICAGAYHNLALDSTGNVWAWGLDSSGQLGDGGTTQQKLAEQLTTLSGVNVQALSAGAYHSLLLTTGGAVMAWGMNSNGQLGNGLTTQPPGLITVSGLSTIIAIAGGSAYSVALGNDGTVWSWGYNSAGQIGNNSTTQQTSPVQVMTSDGGGGATPLSNIVAICAGASHALAVDSSGYMWAWGSNSAGELGDGTTVQRNMAVQTTGINGPILFTAGIEDSLVLNGDGTVWVFGANNCGQLGDGISVSDANALPILGLNAVQQISGGIGKSNLALDNSNNVWAWGLNNNGEVGDETYAERVNPVLLTFTGLSSATITAVATNSNRSMALASNGDVWSWGGGPIGNGYTSDANQPVHLTGLSAITAITAIAEGGAHSMALDSTRHVWTWGVNGFGALGINNYTQKTSPVEVLNYSGGTGTYLSGVTAIAAGDFHSLALVSGAVYAWGYNGYGELGTGNTTTQVIPTLVTGLSTQTIVALSAGYSISAALDSNGHVWTWGYGLNGALGYGGTTSQSTPVEVKNADGSYLSNVASIHCGEYFCTAVKSDGTVWGWGNDQSGQLGDGATLTNRLNPVQAANVNGATAIAGGYTYSIALKKDGTMQSWGYNGTGALGVQANYAVPFAISGFNALASALTPSISITAPANNTSLSLGNSQTFTASASETGGTIASVKYYINATWVHTSTTGSSYSYSWTPNTWGNFTFNAVTTDTNGNTSYLSSPITVQVPYTGQVVTPVFNPGAGTYTSAQNVIVRALTPRATIYYTADGSTPTTGSSSIASGGTISVASSETIKVIAAASGFSNSTVASATYTIQVPAATPTFSPGPGTYLSSQTVTLSSATSGATIYYTTDGTTPTIASSSVSSGGTIAVAASETVKAMATASGYNNSAVASASYTIQVAAATPIFSPAAGTYTSSQTVTLSSSTSGATIYYTTDGTTPTTSSSSMSSGGTLALAQTETLNAIAAANGYNNSAVASAGYTIQTQAAAPTFTPVAGTYTSSQTVTLGSSTSGATIYYTTDDTTPTTSSPFVSSGGTITVAASETVQAMTVAGGYNNSAVTSAAYTIQITPTAPTLTPAPGIYTSPKTITVSTVSGATIYYTTNGEDPTTSSSSISNGGQLTVSSSTLYKFIAVIGASTSPETTALYKIGIPNDLQAGNSFSLVRKPDGTVWTWGDNGYGQQGDNGVSYPAAHPVQVPNLTGVICVAAAGEHAFAVKTGGSAWAWGADDQSQAGDGGTSNLLVPTQISGLSNIAKIYAGELQGFAVDTNGHLYGWGKNDLGQLGDGTTNNQATPEQIYSSTGGALSGVVKVVSGNGHTLLLKLDGTVWASGSNASGQLGDGTTNNVISFEQILSLANVVDIAAGGNEGSYGSGHSMALLANGTVWTWGEDGNGELGDGGSGSLMPEEISLPSAVAIVASDTKSFVILADGTVRCFGGNSSGQMGNGNNQDQASPVEPSGIANVALLAAGANHTVVCTTTGALYGWGDNGSFKLTQDFFDTSLATAAEVHDPAWQGFTSVASAYNTTIALKNDGTVWTTGNGSGGTLGNGLWDSSQRPVQVVGLSNITKIAAGNATALAIDSSGALWAWGANYAGQLGIGNGNWLNAPQPMTIVQKVTSAAAGENHVLIAESDGTVWATGDDSQGELGDGTSNNENAPIQVAGFGPSGNVVTQVAAGGNTSFALDTNGVVWAWGQNDVGQLGLGTTDNVPSPTAITTLPVMTTIAATGSDYAGSYAIGIDTSGNIWTWGGMGDPDDGTPIEQTGVTNLTAVSAGLYHALALKNDGTVWGLGADGVGQLGDPSYNYADSFTQVSSIKGAVSVSAGSDYYWWDHGTSMIAKQDGSISGFGECSNGQLAANLGVYDYLPKPLFGIALTETSPTVSISAPSAGASCPMGTAIQLQSSATASTGSITEVDYYLNGVKLGASTTSGTWDFSYFPPSYGNFTFEAVAHDSAGVAQVSAPVTINVPYDSDNNGLPDWWELNYFGQLGNDPNALDATDDGNTLLQDYQSGTMPTQGIFASFSMVSGNNQTGPSGSFLSSPLVVRALGGTSQPLQGIPVTFTVTQSSGLVSASMQGTSFQSTTIQTDGNGLAQAYFQQPVIANNTSHVTATANLSSSPSPITFTASTPTNSGPPTAPSTVTAISAGNGEIDLSWNNTADNATSIIVQQQSSDGSWSNIGTALDPSQDSLSITGLTIDSQYNFRVVTSNASGQAATGLPTLVQATATSAIPPRFVVIDLGAGMDPVKITKSGHILMKDPNGAFYRWQGGSTGILTGPTTIYEITDIGEDGSVVGDDGASHLLSWNPTSNLAMSVLLAPLGDDGTVGKISHPYLSPRNVGTTSFTAESSNYLWSTQSKDVPSDTYTLTGGPYGPVTAPAGFYQETDGYYDHSEIGSYKLNFNNPAIWPLYDEDVGYHGHHNLWYSGHTIVPMGANILGHAVCLRTDFQVTTRTDPSYLWSGSPPFQSTSPTPTTSTVNPYPYLTSYVLSDKGGGGSSLIFQPTSLNNDDCVIGPPSGPSTFWSQGASPSLPAGFNAGSLNAAHGTNGKPAYQILGTTDGTNLQLVEMDSQNQKFGTPHNIADLVIPSSSTTWSSFSADFSFGLSQVINDGGAMVGTAGIVPTDSGPIVQHGILLLPAELAVDYNRDGKVVMANDPGDPANVDADGKPLPVDTTSQAKPYRFWVNNDQDTPGTGGTPEKVPVTTPDWKSDYIVSARDLEDWTRLWIYTKGLNTAIKAGTIKVGLKWRSVTGTPGIKIADARDADGGLEYLTDTTRGSAQTTSLEASDVWYTTNITPSSNAADFIFQQSTWNNLSDTAPITHFLFEATGEGKGQLVIVFLKSDNTELGEGPGVWLDLHDIKEMYEREIASPQPAIPVGTATPVAPNLTAAPDTAGGTFVSDPDESSPHTYVVFVHGFNQTYNGSTNFAETMFKRLWWRGYKGRFAAFRWPTYGSGTDFGAVGTYNDSEYVAWHSGTALKTFVQGLPSGYAVDIAAHSMGNLVVGEALREGMTVNHYAMLHAATSASCYSNATYLFPTTDTSGILAPDNDGDPGTSGLAYTKWLGGIGSSPKNFYDTSDSVVGSIWDANNAGFKPQAVLTGAYAYQGWQPVGQRLSYNSFIATRYLTDQGEVKAYDDHSLTGAIGHIATTSNGSIASSNNDSSFGDEHSSEWIRNIQDPTIQTFYQTLTGAACFNLQVNP